MSETSVENLFSSGFSSGKSGHIIKHHKEKFGYFFPCLQFVAAVHYLPQQHDMEHSATLQLNLIDNVGDDNDTARDCQESIGWWRNVHIVFRVLMMAALLSSLKKPERYATWFHLAACGNLCTGLQILNYRSGVSITTLMTLTACTSVCMVGVAAFIGAVLLNKVDKKTNLLVSNVLLSAPPLAVVCSSLGWRAGKISLLSICSV
jgi:VanZ family protein